MLRQHGALKQHEMLDKSTKLLVECTFWKCTAQDGGKEVPFTPLAALGSVMITKVTEPGASLGFTNIRPFSLAVVKIIPRPPVCSSWFI